MESGSDDEGEKYGFARYRPGVDKSIPAPTVSVRTVSMADLEGIAGIQASAGRAPLSSDSLVALLADPNRLCVVAVESGRLVGWAKTHFWAASDGQAPAGHYLGGVTVKPAQRRRGVARALIDARLEWIWKRSNDAWFVVNSLNRASIDLHRRWGFTEMARSPSFHNTVFSGGEGILFHAETHRGDGPAYS
jgi:aminoglycoside 6'-N-acetyltransferase I